MLPGRILTVLRSVRLGMVRLGRALHPVRLLRFATIAAAVLFATSRSSLEHGINQISTGFQVVVPDSLRGKSGRMATRLLRSESPEFRPAVWQVRDSTQGSPFAYITLVPFEEKRNDRVGVYRVGRWPSETRQPRNEAYLPPKGFVEVTEENQDLMVSTHFRLRDFLAKDQANVWPKALVLDERLVDKLELIITELRLQGHYAPGLTIASGFRSPQYNARLNYAERATDSRHSYGDAADIFVDADGDGRMDDLNRDGRIDILDALALVEIIERVEARHPDLVGGVGIYRSTSIYSPFVHVDVRGERIRWGF